MTSSFGGHGRVIRTNQQFEDEYIEKINRIIRTEPVNRGAAHAMKDDTTASTHELMYVFEHFSVDEHPSAWVEVIRPNLPWAEDHFEERVSGKPLNPAPSEAWWPFARKNNAEHKDAQEKFSHTYPERFWPKFARGVKQVRGPIMEGREYTHEEFREYIQKHGEPVVLEGIRFEYGDLNDLLIVLAKNPKSRQAYLPIWFPEDLSAARDGLRVPCSMGYHFIWCDECQGLDCVYTMRSCDLVRFYRDDIYMAGRLLQWVAQTVDLKIGTLVTQIANLHCFPGDIAMLETQVPEKRSNPRDNYNFGAMY